MNAESVNKINAVVSHIIDQMYLKRFKKNYLNGMKTMEDLAPAAHYSEIASLAFDQIMRELPPDQRDDAVRILGGINLY